MSVLALLLILLLAVHSISGDAEGRHEGKAVIRQKRQYLGYPYGMGYPFTYGYGYNPYMMYRPYPMYGMPPFYRPYAPRKTPPAYPKLGFATSATIFKTSTSPQQTGKPEDDEFFTPELPNGDLTTIREELSQYETEGTTPHEIDASERSELMGTKGEYITPIEDHDVTTEGY